MVDFLNPLQRYLEMMPTQDDVSLIVLKGHLLVEERLERVLRTGTPNPEYLKEAKLTFYQKVWLCRSFSRQVSDSKAWPVILKVNSLRNSFAHSLEPPNVESKINDLVSVAKNCSPTIFSRDLIATLGPLGSLRLALLVPLPFLQLLNEHLSAFVEASEPLFVPSSQAAQKRLKNDHAALSAALDEIHE